MLEWLLSHSALFWWLATASLLLFVGTLLVIPWIVVRIPADYFRNNGKPQPQRTASNQFLAAGLLVLKNLIGFVLVVMGIVMCILPGQGLLTILIGLLLVDFPGKRGALLWIVRRKKVLQSINWIRERAHKPPLDLPPERQRDQS